MVNVGFTTVSYIKRSVGDQFSEMNTESIPFAFLKLIRTTVRTHYSVMLQQLKHLGFTFMSSTSRHEVEVSQLFTSTVRILD